MPKRDPNAENSTNAASSKKSRSKTAAASEKPKRGRKLPARPVPANDVPEAARAPAAERNELPDDKTVTEEMIRITAYQRWEAAGKPPGEETRFWLEAEQALMNGK
jgi:hypothetical protein